MTRPTIPPGPDVALRAVGVALAAVSIAFACEMLVFGDGKVRVFGIKHLAIFAQPRGAPAHGDPPPASPPSAKGAAVDMAATGSVAAPAADAPLPARPEIVAARPDRVWLRIGGKIVAAAPGEDVDGLGRVGAIVQRGGDWTVLDGKGAPLITLPAGANGAALFTKALIFN